MEQGKPGYNHGTILKDVTAGGNITVGDPSAFYFLQEQLRAKDKQIDMLLNIIKNMSRK